MSVRKLLLFLGVVLVLAGLGLSFVWLNRVTTQAPQTAQPAPKGPAILVASVNCRRARCCGRAISAGRTCRRRRSAPDSSCAAR